MASTQQIKELNTDLANLKTRARELTPEINALKTAIETAFSTSGKSSSGILANLKAEFENVSAAADNYFRNTKGGTDEALRRLDAYKMKLQDVQRILNETAEIQTRTSLAVQGQTGAVAKQAMTNPTVAAAPGYTQADYDLANQARLAADKKYFAEQERETASYYNRQVTAAKKYVADYEAALNKLIKTGNANPAELTYYQATLTGLKGNLPNIEDLRQAYRSKAITASEYNLQMSQQFGGQGFNWQQLMNNVPDVGMNALNASLQRAKTALPQQTQAGAQPNAAAIQQYEQAAFNLILNEGTQTVNSVRTALGISVRQAYQALNNQVNQGTLTRTGRYYNLANPPAGAVPQPTPIPAPIPTRPSDLTPQQLQAALSGPGIQSIFADTTKLDAFRAKVSGLGLDFRNITGITKELSTGISTIRFEAFDAATASVQNYTAHVDQFGRVLTDTGTRFRSFTEAIQANIVKGLEWSVALGLVYGSIAKINQIAQDMIKIQESMTHISIVTKATGQDLNNLFVIASQAAKEIGVSLTDSIEAFSFSLKVVGSAAGEFDRVRIATTLLKDALTLAKLSGDTVANSMDTLTAALEQSGLKLDQGTFLLDKFQAVANASGGTIDDIARTFSITAGAAADVGVKIDDLTGIVGAFATTTTLSAQETGNALRAMFANFTSEKAISTLNQFGIAVKDVTTGEFKNFPEVFGRVASLIQSGILTPRQTAEIADALGGGSRRGAQVTALLQQYQKAQEFANVSMKAGGDAAQALSQKTQTLETAIIRLSDSFQSLAGTLGSEGGVLSALTGVVSILDKIIGLFSAVTTAIGPATAALMAFGVASAVNSQMGPRIAGGIMNMFAPTEATRMVAAGKGNWLPRVTASEETVNFAQQASRDSSKLTGIFNSIFSNAFAPVLTNLIFSLSAGDIWSAAGGTIGGIAGAVLGKSPIWATVGVILGDIILKQLKAWAELRAKGEAAVVAPITPKTTIQEAQQGFMDISGLAPGPANVYAKLTGQNSTELLMKAVQNLRKAREEGQATFVSFGFTEAQLAKAEQYLGVIEKITAKLQENKGVDYTGAGQFAGIDAIIKKMTDDFEAAALASRKDLVGQLGPGGITGSEYKNRITALQTAQTSTPNVAVALFPALNQGGASVDLFKNKILELYQVLAKGPPESVTFINELASKLNDLQIKISDLQKFVDGLKQGLIGGIHVNVSVEQIAAATTELNKLKTEYSETQQALVNVLNQTNQIIAQQFKFQGFQDFSSFSPKEMDKIKKRALAEQQLYQQTVLDNKVDLSLAAPDTILKTQQGFETMSGIFSAFMDDAKSKYAELKKAAEDAFNFESQRNTPISALNQIQRGINYYTQLLKAFGFNEKAQVMTILFSQNQVGQLVGSQTALRLALEDLTTEVKKQVEGVYNIPQGAMAFVPVTAASTYHNAANNAAPVNYPNAPALTPGSYPNGAPGPGTTAFDKAVEDAGKHIQIKKPEPEFALPKEPPGTRHPGMPYGATESTAILSSLSSILADLLKATSYSAEGSGGKVNKYTGVAPGNEAFKTIITPMLEGLTKFLVNPYDTSSGMKAPGLAAPPIKMEIYPQKLEQHQTLVVQLQVSGRTLADIVKPFLFEDYQQLTGVAGSSGRQSGNIIS